MSLSSTLIRQCPSPACLVASTSSAVCRGASGRRSFHPTCQRKAPKLDPYGVLDLPRKATKKEIKERFYELSKKYHPDLRPNDEEAKEKYLEISSAYDTLGNPSKRNAYDNSSSGRAAHYGSSAPNITRTGRQSTWTHPSTRMPPRPKSGTGPSAAWSHRRPLPSSTGYSTGRDPLRGTTSSFGPYGDPNANLYSAWDKVANDEFSKPLRRTGPSFFSGAIPSRVQLGEEVNSDGLKHAFGLGMMLSLALGLMAGVQGEMFWRDKDQTSVDRRRNEDDSRLARRKREADEADDAKLTRRSSAAP